MRTSKLTNAASLILSLAMFLPSTMTFALNGIVPGQYPYDNTATPAQMAVMGLSMTDLPLSQNTWVPYLLPGAVSLSPADLVNAPTSQEIASSQNYENQHPNACAKCDKISVSDQLLICQTMLNNMAKYGPIFAADINSGNMAKLWADAVAVKMQYVLEQPYVFQILGAKPFTQAQMTAFYVAAQSYWNIDILGQIPTDPGDLGKYQWGDGSKLPGDAITNFNTAGDNQYPDLSRFAGQRPPLPFMAKWGLPIITDVVAAIFTAGIGSAIATAVTTAADVTTATTVGAIESTAITIGSNAVAGAAVNLGMTAISGGNLNVGKALLGGLEGAAVGYALLPVTGGISTDLSGAGVPVGISNYVASLATGVTASAILSGGNISSSSFLNAAVGAGVGLVSSSSSSSALTTDPNAPIDSSITDAAIGATTPLTIANYLSIIDGGSALDLDGVQAPTVNMPSPVSAGNDGLSPITPSGRYIASLGGTDAAAGAEVTGEGPTPGEGVGGPGEGALVEPYTSKDTGKLLDLAGIIARGAGAGEVAELSETLSTGAGFLGTDPTAIAQSGANVGSQLAGGAAVTTTGVTVAIGQPGIQTGDAAFGDATGNVTMGVGKAVWYSNNGEIVFGVPPASTVTADILSGGAKVFGVAGSFLALNDAAASLNTPENQASLNSVVDQSFYNANGTYSGGTFSGYIADATSIGLTDASAVKSYTDQVIKPVEEWYAEQSTSISNKVNSDTTIISAYVQNPTTGGLGTAAAATGDLVVTEVTGGALSQTINGVGTATSYVFNTAGNLIGYSVYYLTNSNPVPYSQSVTTGGGGEGRAK